MEESTENSTSDWTFIKKTKKKKSKKNNVDLGLFKTIKKHEEYEILIRTDENDKKYYSLKDLISDKLIDYYIISGREQNELKRENASKLNRYLKKHLEYFFKKPLSKDEELKSSLIKNIKEEFTDEEFDSHPYVLICQQPLIGKHCRNKKKIMKYKGNDLIYCYKKNHGRLTIALHTDLHIYEDNSIIFSPFSQEETNNDGVAKKATFKYSEKDFPESEIKSPTSEKGPSWSDKIKVSNKIDKKTKEITDAIAKIEAQKKAKAEAEKKAKEEEEASKKLREENNNADDGWIDNTQPPKQVKAKRPPSPGLTVLDLKPKYDDDSEEEKNVTSSKEIKDLRNYIKNLEQKISKMNQFIIQQQNKEIHMERHMEMITRFMKMMNRIQTSVQSPY